MRRPDARTRARTSILPLFFAASTLLLACGDDPAPADVEQVTCGAGTELVGTTCEPTETPDPGVSCGPGTQDDGSGQCVPTDEGAVCGPGTTANTDGECVPDMMISCGPGTQDDGAGQCVRICPEGTADDGMGGCTVDGATCPAGTLDDGMGGCAPDLASICAPGTVPSADGARCITPEDAVRESLADETVLTSSEDADPTVLDDPLLIDIVQGQVTDLAGQPLLGVTAINRADAGAANDLTLPAVGNTIVLEGTISLLGDVTDDALDDQDWDVWAFQGTAGQVIEIAALSSTIPEPYVELIAFGSVAGDADFDAFASLDETFADIDVYRAAPTGQYATVQRQFLLPRDGLYFLRLTDNRHEPPSFADGGTYGTVTVLADPGAPTGADDATWFMTVSTVADYGPPATPSLDVTTGPTTWSGAPDSYAQVDAETVRLTRAGGQPGFARVRFVEYDEVVSGVLSLFTGDFSMRIQQFLADAGVDLLLPIPAEGLVISHDYSSLVGSPMLGYEATIVDEPVLAPFQPTTATMPDGATVQHALYAEGDTLLRVTLESPGGGLSPVLALFAFNPDLTQRLVGCVVHTGTFAQATVCNEVAPGEPLDLLRYIEGSPGELIPVVAYVLDVTTGEGAGFGYTVTTETIVPARLALDDATPTATGGFTLAPPSDARWAIFEGELTDETLVELVAASTNADVTLEFYTQPVDGLLTPDTSSTPGNPVSWPLLVQGFERHFIRVATSGATASSSVTLDANALSPPVVAVDDAVQMDQVIVGQTVAEASTWAVFDGSLTAPALVTLTGTASAGDIGVDVFESVDGVLTPVLSGMVGPTSSVDLVVSGAVIRYVRLTTSGASATPDVTLSAEITSQATAYTQTESPALAIPDGGYPDDLAISTQTIAATGCVVAGLSVEVDITHTWAGDTQISLVSPSGTVLRLEDGLGLGSGDFGVHTYPGTRQPLDDLSTLVGEPADGVWTLRVGDDIGFDAGSLNSWTLYMFQTCN